MAYIGWYEYGGTEIINVARTSKYVNDARVNWFRGCYETDDLRLLLEDRPYGSPLQDDAPWLDPDDPNTFNFWGVYPLDISGVEDGTATANVVENTGDGGVIGRVRHTTKTLVFNTVLLGADEAAVEAGFRWLRIVLAGIPCGGGGGDCGGETLCYLSAAPCIPAGCTDLIGCMFTYQRSLRDVGITVGPVITAKRTATDGSTMWVVTWTMVAGNPYEFGPEQPLINGFMDPTVDVPFFGGVVPEGGSFDEDGELQSDVLCAQPTYQPVVDPLCALITPPPPPPTVALDCFDFPDQFLRRQYVIPPQYTPLWNDQVPRFDIYAPADVRNMRVRFYTDVRGTGDPSDDPCNYCSEFTVSYIPANSTLVIDASEHRAYMITPGGTQKRADHLIHGAEGPFDWPALTCGIGYIVTVDMDEDQAPPVLDMSLYARMV